MKHVNVTGTTFMHVDQGPLLKLLWLVFIQVDLTMNIGLPLKDKA